MSEAVVRRYSLKNVFLKISQNILENTCTRVSSLITLQDSGLQAYRPATLLKKRETLAQVFSCEFREIFKNTIFTEYLWWLLFNSRFKSLTPTVCFEYQSLFNYIYAKSCMHRLFTYLFIKIQSEFQTKYAGLLNIDRFSYIAQGFISIFYYISKFFCK